MIASLRDMNPVDPYLLPDREAPYRLHGVYEKIVDGCRDEIVLDFGDCFLRIRADPDTDSIAGEFHGQKLVGKRGYRSIGSTAPWKRHLNANCGWTWLAVNQQGYWDTMLISFDGVVPNLLLNVMASSLYVFSVGPMEHLAAGKTVKPRNNKQTTRGAASRLG